MWGDENKEEEMKLQINCIIFLWLSYFEKKRKEIFTEVSNMREKSLEHRT